MDKMLCDTSCNAIIYLYFCKNYMYTCTCQRLLEIGVILSVLKMCLKIIIKYICKF